jgi:hypothetical protein
VFLFEPCGWLWGYALTGSQVFYILSECQSLATNLSMKPRTTMMGMWLEGKRMEGRRIM